MDNNSSELFQKLPKQEEDREYLGYHVINKPETAPEQEPVLDRKGIGGISNEGGSLVVAKIGDKYGWLMEEYHNSVNDADEYEIIPDYLYEALIKFENEREK